MPEVEHDESEFVAHLPCDKCGSSDASSLYTDGHAYCFKCGAYTHAEGTADSSRPRQLEAGARVTNLIIGEVRGLRTRNITDATCKHFGYMVGEYLGRPAQIAPYFNSDGQQVAQHIRFPDKSFIWLGEYKEALPFGANCWPKTGKMLVVTEGEVDALSMSQVQGNKWPVVSIGCGAGPQVKKYMAKHKAYFNGFEKVILMFDMDEPGRQAAKDAAAVLGSRAFIADLQLKDANEMLVAGRTEELVNAMWRAKEYRPEGILDMKDLKEAVMQRPQWGLSWPFATLTEWTYGIRTGEIIAIGAGTGIGKTDFFTQTIQHLVVEHHQSVGVFALEQAPSETATRIAGKLAKKTFHIPDSGWTDADLEAAWTTMMSSGKVFLYDSFGQNDWQTVKEKIEYLHHAHGVRYFFLDHLTALAAWQDDERKELEVIMSEMGGLVKKLDCTVFLISHLATPDGKPHEEGGRVMIRHLKGSRAIGFWCSFIFGLERDQQHETEAFRTTTIFRSLKDRYTGRSTGNVFYLSYDQDTGMLYETVAPQDGVPVGFRDETNVQGKEDF